jgi:hypothetical protein
MIEQQKVVPFKNIAIAVATYVDDSMTCIRIAEEIHNMLSATNEVTSPDGKAVWDGTSWKFDHNYLVFRALASNDVVDYLKEGKKIQAIKELRALTYCGLKEAKDALEAPEVWRYWELSRKNPDYTGTSSVYEVNPDMPW